MTNPEFSPLRGLDERDIEAPDADALEQAIPADPIAAADEIPPEVTRDPEVNVWDALEQAHVVALEDEEY